MIQRKMTTATTARGCSRFGQRVHSLTWAFAMERVTGIEPASRAWESLYYAWSCPLTCEWPIPRGAVVDRYWPLVTARGQHGRSAMSRLRIVSDGAGLSVTTDWSWL